MWLRVHRWLALSVGWVLILAGLTGAILVVAQPLDRWANPQFFRAQSQPVAGRAPLPLQEVLEDMRAEFGAGASFTLRPPRQPHDSFWVLVKGRWNGTLYLDPVTGAEQGRRGETEGFVNTLFKLHSSLWLQEIGKAILAAVALAYLLLLVTGMILWWPRHWPPSWRIELGKGRSRALFDLHRIGGAALGVFLVVSVATGAYMAWRPLGTAITWVSGAAPVKPPKMPKEVPAAVPGLTLDAMVASAQLRFPGAPIGYVQVPAQQDRPLRVRFMLADDPHPNGISSVWLDPRSGKVLAAQRWDQLDPGARAVAVIYPLHTGVLGGPLLEAVIALGGIALAASGISGIWLWWRRRSRRRH